MSGTVNTPRTYDASRRQESARRTRAATLAAARQLFLAHGYAATTMAAVARAADVSTQQIYKTFTNKPGLVKALFDTAIAGDDEPQTMIERDALTRVREEPDARTKLHLYADFVATTSAHHVPIQLLVRAAADHDAEAATLWRNLSEERLHGMSMFARDLASAVRPDVTVDYVRDVLWTANSPELWDLLVLQRGWAPAQFADLIARTLIHAILPTGLD